MKKCKIFVVIAFILVLFVSSAIGACTTEESTKLRVVTTTSLLAQIVERVGGETVDVVNIIPPSQCPGHFDVKVSDVQKLTDAELFLLHGWQGEMFSEELIASANNPELVSIMVDVKVGENTNWMTPEVQEAAVDKVVAALSQVDAENSVAYEESAAEYKDQIEAKEDEMEAILADEDLASMNVMCADQLTGLVQWMGLNIVTTYGRPDSLTPQVVKELVDTGRVGGVTLIIDNLQSGQDAGAGLAEELGCTRIIFTNFPGGFDNTETWEKTIEYDVELLMEAIAK